MTNVSMLADYLRAAARQRRFMHPWLEDKRIAENGGKILYAVDADIVILYTAPVETSVTTERGREGYAQIFPEDEKNLSIALGRALAEHIFHHLSGSDFPLLIIPPIEEEIREVYNAVARNAEAKKEEARGDLDRLKTLLAELKEKLNEELLNDLPKAAPALFEILAGRRGAIVEFNRFNRLLADTRIAPPEFVLKQGLVTDETVVQALSPIEDVKGWMQIYKLREAWLERLLKTKSKKRYTEIISRDAQALARLEWINNHLDKDSRLVYITGDASLHKAGNDYCQEQGGDSFADLYLRHPKAYLAEGLVLFPNKKQHDTPEKVETELFDWLDTFLAQLKLGGEDDIKKIDGLLGESKSALEDRVRPVLDTDPNILDRFQKNWAAYVRDHMLVALHETPNVLDGDALGVELVGDIGILIERVERQLEEKIRESWDEFFAAATEAGYRLVLGKKRRSRNLPPLLFNRLPKTQEFAEKVLEPRDYKDAIKNLLEEDPSKYSYYLAFACLLAAEGNWHVSAILAGRAMDIARKCPKATNISGREATYLRAVAMRHNASSVKDLDKLAPLLDEAEKCLAIDRGNRPGLPGGEIRFKAERLAIYWCYHMFRLFLGKETPSENVVPTLAQLQEKVEALLNELEEIEIDKRIVRKVERSLLTNLFMTALLRWGKGKEKIDMVPMRPYFDRFRNNFESKETRSSEISFQIKAVYLAAGWWTTEDSKEKEQFQNKLISHLTDLDIQENSVAPFDKQRFEFLRDIVSGKIFPAK